MAALLPMPSHKVTGSPVTKMRVPILCEDYKRYLENPQDFFPEHPICLNSLVHKPYWNMHWERGFLPDHIHEEKIPMFQAYCEECHETISYWPEFILPYQREALETHEWALIEHLRGMSFREIGERFSYDPRTISGWVNLALVQSIQLFGEVMERILQMIGHESLPIVPTSDWRMTQLLLAWLRRYAEWIHFPHFNRLMGLCNLLGKGDWDLWGGPLGNAKSRVNMKSSPP